MKKLGLNVLKGIGLLLLVLAVNMTPLQLISHRKAFGAGLSWLLAAVYLVFVMAVIYYLWRYYKTLNPKPLGFGWKDLGYGFIWFAAARVIAVVGTLLIMMSSGQMTSANDAALKGFAEQLKGGFTPLAILYISLIIVIAPIIEELIFRGLFTELFFKNHPKWVGWLVTSLLFAILHATAPLEILMYFAIGSVLYLAYSRRGDIRDSILAHFLNNLLPGIALALLIFL